MHIVKSCNYVIIAMNLYQVNYQNQIYRNQGKDLCIQINLLNSSYMRIVVQRVFESWVKVQGVQISRIKDGILVLVGITEGDTPQVVQHMANKALNMRLWPNNQQKAWSSSVMDIKGQVMAVSQFTLYGILKGNKPDFHGAMQADKAKQLFDLFVSNLRKKYNENRIQTGKFQALMQVGSVINGPVTIQYQKMAQQKKQKILKPKTKKEESKKTEDPSLNLEENQQNTAQTKQIKQ